MKTFAIVRSAVTFPARMTVGPHGCPLGDLMVSPFCVLVIPIIVCTSAIIGVLVQATVSVCGAAQTTDEPTGFAVGVACATWVVVGSIVSRFTGGD